MGTDALRHASLMRKSGPYMHIYMLSYMHSHIYALFALVRIAAFTHPE